MRETYRKLFEILSARDRRVVMLVLVVMLIAAVMETIGIASILPFIAVLSNPDFIHQNQYLRAAFDILGFEETQSFLVFLGVSFLSLFLFGLAMRTLSFWIQARFANSRSYNLSTRVFFGYLCKDYSWFLGKHSARLSSSVLSEVDRCITQGLFPALQLIAHTMVILLLVALLFVLDPILALSVVVVLGGAYLLIYFSIKNRVVRIGGTMLTATRGRFRTIQEGLGGIKDLKMKGLETSYLDRFREHAAAVARSRTSEQLIGQLPGYAMQGVVFGGMLLVILYLMTVFEDFDQALPVIAMYAVAGYRMMPSLQNGYRHIVTLRHVTPVVNSLHADLQDIEEIAVAISRFRKVDRLPLTRDIRLRDVHFRYPGAEHDALRALDLVIPRCSTVAFVGPTGCGKTTTVDTILGLLQPSRGAVEVDGVPIGPANVRGWQRNIGYVPQDIYLLDATVAANIAFGIPEEAIDHAAVERAAKIARLHDFVLTELKEGYFSTVGERGVRLSGGQKQRIGIARALYHDPEVLVLDEATSALDNLTEHAVMDAVRGLAKQKTIIMIAHRLTTVQSCDRIFLLDEGQVIAQGSHAELLETSQAFRDMTGTVVAG